MPVQVTWRGSKPNAGLRAAMQRIACEIADEGEYSVVDTWLIHKIVVSIAPNIEGIVEFWLGDFIQYLRNTTQPCQVLLASHLYESDDY